MKIIPVIFLSILFFVSPWAPASNPFQTQEILLNGTWEYQRLPFKESFLPPISGTWLKTPVPGKYPDLYGPHDAIQASDRAEIIWYRTRFNISAPMTSKILKIRFEAVQYGGEVYVNGKMVGKHSLDCRMPEEFDITAVARIGENEMLVSARDWRMLLVDGRTSGDIGDLNFMKDTQQKYDANMPDTREDAEKKRSYQRDVYPPGSWSNFLGIREDVKLLAIPTVHIEDVWVVTSVKEKRIRIQVTVRNESKQSRTLKLSGDINDWTGQDKTLVVKQVPPCQIDVPAGTAKVETIESSWENPALWWPYDPHLYVLNSVIAGADGKILHQKETRFGFREIDRTGTSVKLNGRKIHLFGSHDLVHRMTYDAARECGKHLRAGNVNTARFWHGSATAGALDAFDENGILVINEFYGMGTPLQNEKFWNNAREGARRRIIRDRNHPSVIIWSSNNEYMAGAPHPHFDRGYNKRKLSELGDYIKQLDSTRLVVHEGNNTGEGDIIGNEDIICPHYAGETSSDAYLVPNYFDWLKQYMPTAKRPLFMGESVWPPVFGGMEYWLMFDVGEKAFSQHAGYASGVFDLGRANMTSFVAERYRYYDMLGFSFNQISAIGPPFEQKPEKRDYYKLWSTAVVEAYKPIRTFIREYDSRFFAGDTVERTVTLHNDSFQDKDLQARWSLEAGTKVLESGNRDMHILSGEFARWRLALHMPKVAARTEAVLKLSTYEGGKLLDERNHVVSIFPREVRVSTARVLKVYDPMGETEKLLSALNIGYTKIKNLVGLDPKEVLIIGAGCWNETIINHTNAIWTFVAQGGRIICFEQRDDLRGLPVELRLNPSHPSTINYRRSPSHPLLKDIQENDLKYWRGDNIAAARNFKIPSAGSFRVVADTASSVGLVRSPFLEIPHGRGLLIFSQFDIHSKFSTEPAARILVRNMIEYACGTLPSQAAAVAVFTSKHSLLNARLKKIGLVFEENPTLPSSRFNLIIIDSEFISEKGISSQIQEFARQGGTVIVHNLNPKSPALSILPFDVRLTPVTISHPWPLWIEPVVYKSNDDPLVWGLSNQSLFWGGSNRYQTDFEIGLKKNTVPGQSLVKPSFLMRVPFGKGQFILDQIKWDKQVEKKGNPTGTVNPVTLIPADIKDRQEEYLRQLLTNLGADLNPGPEKLITYQYAPVDLKAFCNMGFADDREDDRQGGWTDQGSEKDLRNIPTGRQTFSGVPFDIINPEGNKGKSCIVLAGGPKLWFPAEIKGIPVNRRADILCFLHTMAWTVQQGQAGYYLVHYADGSSEKINLIGGVTIQEWFLAYASDVQEPLSLAWRDAKRGVYLLRWRNPRPEKEIKTVDFVSNKLSIPILIGLTTGILEERKEK